MRSAPNCPASRLPPNSETPSLLECAAPNAAPRSPLTHRRTTTPSTSILARRPPRLLPHSPGRTPPSSNARPLHAQKTLNDPAPTHPSRSPAPATLHLVCPPAIVSSPFT